MQQTNINITKLDKWLDQAMEHIVTARDTISNAEAEQYLLQALFILEQLKGNNNG